MKSTMLSLALGLCGMLGAAQGGDWAQWGGGQHRNMLTEEKNLPVHFIPGRKKDGTEEIDMATTQNVKWVAKLGSQTYGNPVISGGKVFIGTNNETPRDPRHQGDRGVLMCFEEATGKFLWQLVVPKLASGKVNDWERLGIMSSALIEGDKLYVVTNRCEVLCLDVNGMTNGNDGPFKHEGHYMDNPVILYDEKKTAAKPKFEPQAHDADILWRYDMMDELGVFPHNASNCSIVSRGDLLYVVTSNGQDWSHVRIPADQAPSVIALNKKTGAFVAEDDIQQGPRIFHGLWSNPSLAKVGDQDLLFYGGGDGWLYAFNAEPQKGEDTTYLKYVWKYDCNKPEYRTVKYPLFKGPSEIISTPTFYKDRIYVAIGQDPEHGEGVGNLVCVNAKTGEPIWTNDKIMRSLSTCAIHNGLIFLGDFSGNIWCFDAETGKEQWMHASKSHFWSSGLAGDGKLYIGNEAGDFFIFAAEREKKLLNADKDGKPLNFGPGSAIYSTPVVANGVMYIATQTHLYVVHAPAGEKAPEPKAEPRKDGEEKIGGGKTGAMAPAKTGAPAGPPVATNTPVLGAIWPLLAIGAALGLLALLKKPV